MLIESRLIGHHRVNLYGTAAKKYYSTSMKLIPSIPGKNFGFAYLNLITSTFSEMENFKFRFGDVSVTMRQRAVEGYGLEADFKPDSELMQDVTTRELWSWVDTCRKLAQSGNPLGVHFMGIR